MSSPRAVPRLVGVALLCLALLAATASGEFVFDDDLEDLIAEESNVDEELAPGSVLLPSDVFNDGKPFYVERDPSTGAIDFNHKKTGNQIEMDDERRPYESIKESYVSDKKDVIVHHSTPNFHDFLNLPKMYSPENFVSISSSYANLKYQGSNKGSNHRDQAHIVSVTAVAPTTTGPVPSSSSTKFFFSRPQYGRPTASGGSTPASSPTYTYPVTSGRPITISTTTTPAPTTTSTTTAATTEEEEDASKTTGSPPKQLFTRYPYKSTIKNKYLETSEQTRKKFFLPSTLALPGPTTTTTTTTERAPSTPVRSSTYYSPSVRPQWPTTTTTTTPAPTTTLTPSSTAPAHPVRFVDDSEHPASSGVGSKIKFTMPALKYEGSRPAPFRRMPVQQGSGGPGSSDREPGNSGSASNYNKIELPKNPAVMSLSDIFSTLEQKKRLEAEGNRVEAVEQATSTTPPAIVLLDDRRTTTVYGEGPKIEQSVDLSDHYVSYEVHHQPSSGRPIAFQSQQQQQHQQPAYQVHQPNGHRPQQPSMDVAGGGQYVQYEVQQPQLNVVQFGAVPSMNSVVISPNQHSATFVLGSQQSVGGAGGVGGAVGPGGHFVGSVSQDSPAVGTAAALIAGRPPYQMGQVLDEPHDPAAAIVGSVQVKPQDIIKTTSVRFPSESDDKYDNAPIISGTHKSEVLPPNGHSAPVRAGDMSSVVFPAAAAHELHEVGNRIVFDSSAPSPAADTLNRHEFAVAPNPHYPADLPEQLTPPSAAQDLKPRPPSAPLRPPVPSQGPPSFRYSEIQRRPATFPADRTRPTLLPNILPQFRPNAKISHGHPPPPHLRESGTYRVGPPAGMFVKTGAPPPLRKPLPYHQQQFGGPNRLPTTRTRPSVSLPSRTPVSAELENRRYYRLPPAPPSPPAVIKDRVYNLQPSRLHAPPPPPPPLPPQQPASATAEQPLEEPLEEHEFHRNPPQILKNLLRDELSGQQRPKLEPVVTLQMLQSKRRVEEGGSPASGVELGASTVHPQVPMEGPGTRDRPVYVVYPVKSTPMKLDRPGTDTIIVRGEHPPPPPAMVISPGTEYQNTPFSIASHFEQEPILVAKHKKVAHPNANSVKLNFPYSMEKPDPHALTHPVAVHPAPAQDLAAEYSEYNLGEEPSGGLGAGAQEQDQDLISSKLQRFHSSTDSTPIAIAYTPTESSLGPVGGVQNSMRYNKPPIGAPGGAHNHNNNYYYSVYGETQTEVSHLKLDDVDEFGNPSRRYEQSFQAPFQASMSLDPVKVTNPYEGWAVVTSSPQALALQHSKPSPPPPKLAHPEPAPDRNTIDRSDTSATGAEDDQVAVTPGERPASVVTPAASAGPFDPNSFQPELQGGFRPILGADVKLSEQLNPDPQRSSIADLFADDPPAAVAEQSEPVPKPQATKLQLVPKDTKPKVVKKEEPDGMEDLDLEAFFDRLSKDYDDGELDDVTMSDETTNGSVAGSGEKQRAVGEGRSSQGANGIAADEATGPGTEGTSRTPETTTTTVVNEKPTTATEAT